MKNLELERVEALLLNLESTSARGELSNTLSAFLVENAESVNGDFFYFLTGVLAPPFRSVNISYGLKNLLSAYSNYFGVKGELVLDNYRSSGDIGIFFEKLDFPAVGLINQPILGFSEMFEILLSVSKISGTGSLSTKGQMVMELMSRVSSVMRSFIARFITGSLNIGVMDKTIIEAISKYISGDKTFSNILELNYGYLPDFDKLWIAAREQGAKLSILSPSIGIPVLSKLVERESSFDNLFLRAHSWYAQPKLDGLRCQIQYSQDKGFFVFSRNLEDLTSLFTDIKDTFVGFCESEMISSIIVDGEIIGVRDNQFVDFQETVKRRGDGSKELVSFETKVYLFDMLYLNGKNLCPSPLSERLGILGNQKVWGDMFVMCENQIYTDATTLTDYFNVKVSQKYEGIVVKRIDSIYSPGTRNYDWIKMKKSIDKKLIDTLDLVILGYYFGQGKRAQLGIGGILCGVYDQSDGSFKTVCKVGTGFTDSDLIYYKSILDKCQVDKLYYSVPKDLLPDVICRAEHVVEVEADDITVSKKHTSGYSVRFPRIIRHRLDKSPKEATIDFLIG